MARMPKCSGPTAWTRGVSWPLGFCSTKPFLALAGGADRRRGMGFSFQEEGCCILNPKGRVGKERDFFAQLTPIPRFFGTLPRIRGLAQAPFAQEPPLPRVMRRCRTRQDENS